MRVIKVPSGVHVNNTAKAVAQALHEYGEANVQAMGPTAVNQMVKSIATSRKILSRTGFDLTGAPGFFQRGNISGMKMVVRRITIST